MTRDFWGMTPFRMGNSWRLLDPGDDGSIILGNALLVQQPTRLNIPEEMNLKIRSVLLQ